MTAIKNLAYSRIVALAMFLLAGVLLVMWIYPALPGNWCLWSVALGVGIAIVANILESRKIQPDANNATVIQDSGKNKMPPSQRFLMFLALMMFIFYFSYYIPDIAEIKMLADTSWTDKNGLIVLMWSTVVPGLGFLISFSVMRGNHIPDIESAVLRKACMSIMAMLSITIVVLAYLIFGALGNEKGRDLLLGYISLFIGMSCIFSFIKMGLFRFGR